MKIYLKEKIGVPELFTGRKKELTKYLKWTEGIKKEISQSTAILSRRKTGKTALFQRLYNLIFHQNSGVIPFYYELGEGKRWAVDFCKDFFMTFIWQYIAFKTRKPEYMRLTSGERLNFQKASDTARQEGLEYLTGFIEGISTEAESGHIDNLWDLTREAPLMLANHREEFIVQIIDEFQFLNSEIYWDEAKTNRADDFAAGYMRTAEYKNAPLLVSGSWVGWLMNLLIMMLPGRFILNELENMPQNESAEAVFRYSQIYDIPVTEETAYLIAELSEGNPFYISSLFKSQYPGKDLVTEQGLLDTLEFETLDKGGIIRGTWMEYVDSAFSRVNETYAKRIVIYLCRNRDREITRKELRDKLALEMNDYELEKKLKALVKSDIIEQGQTNFDYHGVRDNIFDKVFRGVYQKEIEAFDAKEITGEYKRLFEEYRQKYRKLVGKFSQMKGAFAEYLIINRLRYKACRENDAFIAATENLPEDFRFVEYESVWSYHAWPLHKRELKIDVFARASEDEYSVIGEVKNRETAKFSRTEAEGFLKKIHELKEIEHIEKYAGFVYSLTGFTADALDFFKEHGIAWSEDELWLGE